MHIHRAVYVALLVAATATACSSSDEPETTRATVTKTAPASPTKAAVPNDGTLKLGAVRTIDDDFNNIHITVQALAYQQPYEGKIDAPDAALGGDTWSTISVKLCNVSGPAINVSHRPWSLAYADGTNVETTGLSGGNMPKPEFPMDKTVKAGRCAAGLIAFPVDGSKQPARVVYEPDGTEPTEWAVSTS